MSIRRETHVFSPTGIFFRGAVTLLVAVGFTLSSEHGIKRSAASDAGTPTRIVSIRTALSGPKCRLDKADREKTSVTYQCPGVGGYRLLVEDSDARMSLTIVAQDGKKSSLNFWTVVTPYFSSLGREAEWRATDKAGKVVPHALIVQLDAHEKPDSNQLTSYFVIAKISTKEICVTDKIRSSPNAELDAKHAADSSGRRVCLNPLEK